MYVIYKADMTADTLSGNNSSGKIFVTSPTKILSLFRS